MRNRFENVYADEKRAAAYADLELPGSYYLAYRDLPELIGPPDGRALDFGCGAGRSTRFLRGLGFPEVVGADISAAMIDRARAADPEGDYRLVASGGLDDLPAESFSVILSSFTFDNVPMADKAGIFRQFRRLLAPGGRFVNLVSAPEIYFHEWTSFSTREFAENRAARTGDTVRIVMLDVPDRRPVEDVYCPDDAYRALYADAGFCVERVHRPLGRADDPFDWVTESRISPWMIYVLRVGGVD
jgi:SAM-dependent methyltransferase